MVSINYATREVSCKIVYYGPGLSGKTTNLQYVHQKVPGNTKGKLISLATDADRTLYFDFLPINIGTINGFAAKFQLYTVPGQVYYNATRKLVLRGVDGLVFVADSQPDKTDENIESLNNLKENLAEYGYKLEDIPIVIQYNKQDLPNVLKSEEMRSLLNPHGWPEFAASATEGYGVFDTLKCILKLVLDKAKSGGNAPRPAPPEQVKEPPAAVAETAPPASPQPPPISPPSQTVPSEEPVSPQPQEQAAEQPYSEEEPEPMPPVREPVMQAPGSGSPLVPEPQVRQTSPRAAQPQEMQREEVAPAAPAEQEKPPSYRPFPGNTLEDERRMKSHEEAARVARDAAIIGQVKNEEPAQMPSTPDETGINDTEPTATGMPRMAPSLKADKPRKKRSFFKRLFGLK